MCNILFTKSLTEKLKGSSVMANCLHPGLSSTEMGRNFSAFYKMIGVNSPIFRPFHKTIEESAQTSVYLAVEPSLEKVSGQYFSDCKLHKSSQLSTDKILAEQLWDESIKLTRCNQRSEFKV